MNDSAANQLFCAACKGVYRAGYPRCPRDGGELQPLLVDPLVGTSFLERYVIEDFVGEGAMGRVYRARHLRMSRRFFAIKVMFGDLAADTKMRSRFEREAEASSRLNHPNVVSVVDFGESPSGLIYMVMDFIEGENLADLLTNQGAIPEARAIALAEQLALGLQHAHEQGLIHRDLKSDNIVVVVDGETQVAKIVDFGIAMIQESEITNARLTAQGCVVGTPAYMSPEQACGEELDCRTDLFSLGVILYEVLTGKKPFDGTPMEMARQNISSTPPALSVRAPDMPVSPELESIVFKLLEKDRARRFDSASELLLALDSLPGGARRAKTRETLAPQPRPTDPVEALVETSAKELSRAAMAAPRAAKDAAARGPASDTGAIEDLARQSSAWRQISGMMLGAGLLITLGLGLAWFNRQPVVEPSEAMPANDPDLVASAEAGDVPKPAEVKAEEPAPVAPADAPVPAVKDQETPRRPTRPRTAERTNERSNERGNERDSEHAPEPAKAKPKPTRMDELNVDEFQARYQNVLNQLERLRDRKPTLAEPIEKRFQKIPFLAAMQKPVLRLDAMRTLNELERDIMRASN